MIVLALLAVGCAPSSPLPPPTSPAPPPPAQNRQIPNPTAIEIPRIWVRAPLVPTARTREGGWEIPPLSRPEQPSWYQPGPEPGEPGPAVILGHINGQGKPGVFIRLDELERGDDILVVTPIEVLHFEVTNRIVQPKEWFDPESVLPPTDQPKLYLITCGGTLQRTERGGRYDSNTIIEAERVPA